MTKKVILVSLFFVGLFYILLPGPSSVLDFSPLPNSLKSDEPGDTIQVPNIAAYFSQEDRESITTFYRQDFADKFFFGRFFPPLALNYPPKTAYTYVRDQLYVTFLEEYIYPLRGSIFVAGYEPYVENEMKQRNHSFIGDHIHINGNYFNSKTTLRYYPTDLFNSLIAYLGIWLSFFALYLLAQRVLKEKLQ